MSGTLSPGESTVGFIGTGVMGAPMAGHVLAAGFDVVVWARSAEKATGLLEAGAQWAETPTELAARADAVVTIVGYPADVEALYFGDDGGGDGSLLGAARPGTYLIDMTTSSPALARRIAEAASARGLRALDAPVTGGDRGAREARLSIMVGGEEADAHAVEPLLRAMGTTVVHHGGPGCGQHAKICNQIAIAASMLGACEALAYARGAGLDQARVLESIGAGSAGSWTLANLAPRILAGDFAPGFFVKHFVKDLRIALASAEELGLEVPGTQLAARLYETLLAAGHGEEGTHALYHLYER
ncbi:MAG: NAD(P)-dependent oxidoreductase [Clostridiales bacterium]|nr:NAD(P)-dependent oxidoreductase [Clostridiales bacterium]